MKHQITWKSTVLRRQAINDPTEYRAIAVKHLEKLEGRTETNPIITRRMNKTSPGEVREVEDNEPVSQLGGDLNQ